MKSFEVYAPLRKSLDSSDDGTLTITGVASTTNQDLTGDIIQESAIASMKEQAVSKNLHGDHHYGLFDGLIGTITEVLDTEDSTLSIKAKILPKYADEIREMLDIGVNLGLSIGGYVTEYTPQKEGGWTIEGFDLMEISLTGMPANWDTFGTITTTKGIVKSKCLAKACIETIKNTDDTMAEDNNNTNVNDGALSEDDVKAIATDLFNELMSEKQEEIVQETVDMVKDKIEEIVDEKTKSTEENTPKEEEEDPKEEDKACDPKEEEEDKEKSIAVEVAKAVSEQMGAFFKQIDENRNPQPHINQVEGKTQENNDGTYTIEEIAKNMTNNNTANVIANAMNKI